MRLSTIFMTFLVTIVTAMPDPLPQGYTGPCSETNCGVDGLNCRKKHQLCVPWPSMEEELRKGCTCSYG
jgi:hypothetical protein